jgi:mono/diheme cytochrome c family protein
MTALPYNPPIVHPRRVRFLVCLAVLVMAACARQERTIARGAYLANGVGRCFWCHSPQDTADPSTPRPEVLGSGDVLDEQLPIVAPNLTPDSETGLGRWTDAEIVRAVRRGIGRDGRRLRADHPATYYSILSDDDAAALVAYLRSLRPIRHELRRSAPQQTYGENVQPSVTPAAPDDTPLGRGAYLVQLGECIGCHTTTTADGKPHRALAFGGGRRFVETRRGYGYELSPDPAFSATATDPPLAPGERIVTSANLTTDPSGIPYYTPELFIRTIRSGKAAGVRPLSSAMPWVYFRNLTDDDLLAIFAYLRTRPPIRHHISNTDPPTFCPVCGRRHGLGDENRAGGN